MLSVLEREVKPWLTLKLRGAARWLAIDSLRCPTIALHYFACAIFTAIFATHRPIDHFHSDPAIRYSINARLFRFRCDTGQIRNGRMMWRKATIGSGWAGVLQR